MGISGILLATLLNVVPQPSEWKPGEIVAFDDAKLGETLGDEGYVIQFDEANFSEPRILAGGETGKIWAKRTLEQLRDSGEGYPKKGTIIDKPKYRLRGLCLDVGRMYHPISFLYKVADLLAYYKMNTFHVHLNDSEICKDPKADWSTKQAAFRMECETFPGLTAKDGSYTKAEFREFMKYCKSIGVTVVPEFDVPAHALAFTRYKPEFASKEYGEDHLDLNKIDEMMPFFKQLFAEYLTGDDPVFIGPYMHVGTDEYNKKEAEKFRLFTDKMFELVEEFGYKPCAWGALTHADGKTPVRASKDITIDIWHNPYYQPEAALKAGYTIVAIPDGLVYLVPKAGYYYDYLNCKYLYNSWEPRQIGNYTVPDEYLNQLAGGKFALWNDMLGKGYTVEDNYQRIFPAVQTLSQKFWSGKVENESWEDFSAIAEKLSTVISGDEWQNNQKLSHGKEPTRAAFSSFDSEEEALKILPEFAKRQMSLDSDTEWKFNWSKDPDSRPKEFFKPDLVANVLCGVADSTIKAYKYNEIPEFGSGKEHDEKYWQTIIRQALVADLLGKNIENYGSLTVTPQGYEFLKNPHSFKIAKERDFEQEESDDVAEGGGAIVAADQTLYSMLCDLRKDIAKKRGLPPYIIFQDPALQDMTIHYPMTMQELGTIPGVGQAKAMKFGQPFCDLISRYVKENEIERPIDLVVKTTGNNSGMKLYIVQSIDRKLGLDVIADGKGLEMSDLLTEMEKIVNSGTKLNIDYYIDEVVDEDCKDDIYEYFREAETDSLEDAIKELGEDDYTEEEIRLVRIKFICDEAY